MLGDGELRGEGKRRWEESYGGVRRAGVGKCIGVWGEVR